MANAQLRMTWSDPNCIVSYMRKGKEGPEGMT